MSTSRAWTPRKPGRRKGSCAVPEAPDPQLLARYKSLPKLPGRRASLYECDRTGRVLTRIQWLVLGACRKVEASGKPIRTGYVRPLAVRAGVAYASVSSTLNALDIYGCISWDRGEQFNGGVPGETEARPDGWGVPPTPEEIRAEARKIREENMRAMLDNRRPVRSAGPGRDATKAKAE